MTILEARKEAGLTQKQVWEKIGIPVRTQQNWEAGIRICPEWCERLIIKEYLSMKEGTHEI